METNSPKKGKIVAIIFVAILVLPVCYALVKELLINRSATTKTETTLPSTDSLK